MERSKFRYPGAAIQSTTKNYNSYCLCGNNNLECIWTPKYLTEVKHADLLNELQVRYAFVSYIILIERVATGTNHTKCGHMDEHSLDRRFFQDHIPCHYSHDTLQKSDVLLHL